MVAKLRSSIRSVQISRIMEAPQNIFKYLFYSILVLSLTACTSLGPLPQIQENQPVYLPFLYSERADDVSELKWGWVNMGGEKQPHGIAAKKYLIFQSIGRPDSMKLIGELEGDRSSYSLPALEEGKLYFYQIKAWANEDNVKLSRIISLSPGKNEEKEWFQTSEEIEAAYASWAGGDDRIALQIVEDGISSIKMGSWGNEKLDLIGQGQDPAWNEDAKVLAFQSTTDTSTGFSQNAIQIVRPSNSIILENTLGGDAPYLHPSWGKLGGQKNWLSYVSFDWDLGNWGIYIYHPEDGANPILVADGKQHSEFAARPSLGRPVWLNDDKDYLLFEEFAEKRVSPDSNYWVRDIVMFDLLEKEPIPLIQSPWDDFAPSISADGKRIAFLSNRSGKTEIWLMTLATRELRQLTGSQWLSPSREVNKLDWSFDGRYILYTHEDGGGRLKVCRLILP